MWSLELSCLFFFFKCRIIALRCCIGFCFRTAWIHHKYIHPSCPSWVSLPHRPHPTLHRAPGWTISPLAIDFARDRVYALVPLSQYAPPCPSPTVSTSLISVSVSLFLTCKRSISGIFLDSIYVCVIIQYLLFSFWLTSLSITGSRFIHLSSAEYNSWNLVVLNNWSFMPTD